MLGVIKQTLPRLMSPAVMRWLRVLRIRTFPVRVVEHTYGDGRLKVYLADHLSKAWYDKDWLELPEISVLRQTRLRPAARVFNIGAHQGVVALMLAREVGASGQVVAVEPNPHNIAVAAKNRELNEMHQIEVVQAAVSCQSGTLIFNEKLNGQLDDGTGAGGRLRVEAVTIDGLAERFGFPDVVFMDVEGAEFLALAGASRVLDSGADFFVEVHVGCGLERLGGTVNEVLSHFRKKRFSILVRATMDTEFRPLVQSDSLPENRFFIIARR
jgi:FkbM family methyltransferase